MKNQGLFSSKDKSMKLKCRLLQFLFGALRVKITILPIFQIRWVMMIHINQRYYFVFFSE